jgi:prepilin-type processing-associated H-X9-DG protein
LAKIRSWSLLLLTAIVLATIAWLFSVASRRNYVAQGRAYSWHHVQISGALLLYAKDHHGQYPDRLEDLVIGGYLTPEALVYPNSDETPARGDSSAALRASYELPGHVSYTYFGKGRKDSDFSKDDVLATDPPGKGEGGGSNVLFGDGHVTFLDPEALRSAVQATQAKHSSFAPATSQP